MPVAVATLLGVTSDIGSTATADPCSRFQRICCILDKPGGMLTSTASVAVDEVVSDCVANAPFPACFIFASTDATDATDAADAADAADATDATDAATSSGGDGGGVTEVGGSVVAAFCSRSLFQRSCSIRDIPDGMAVLVESSAPAITEFSESSLNTSGGTGGGATFRPAGSAVFPGSVASCFCSPCS